MDALIKPKLNRRRDGGGKERRMNADTVETHPDETKKTGMRMPNKEEWGQLKMEINNLLWVNLPATITLQEMELMACRIFVEFIQARESHQEGELK